ncbi:hypothetical protein N9L55_02695 [Alphaproteobacteria bacterium]|nr:hypothetical protein [Alphaproteobacteria bacterium]
MSQIEHTDETDLLQIIQTIWDGRITIISFVIASALTVAGLFVFMPAPDFVATTEIRHAKVAEIDRYRAFNDSKLFDLAIKLEDEELAKSDGDRLYKIDAEFLLELFIEQLRDNELRIEVIKKYNLLDKKDFKSDADFDDAVREFASSLSVSMPANMEGETRDENPSNWTFTAEFNDQDKWIDFLKKYKAVVNEKARETIQSQFLNIVSSVEIQRENDIESLNIDIENAIADYDRTTSDRLAFLKEQAAIARKLGVSKNTIEAQTFNTQGGMIANIETKAPFYLRGYEAIEKEIELILSRDDKKAFIPSLFQLERLRRNLEQDRNVERAERALSFTPVVSGKDFMAATFEPAATKFKSQDQRLLMLALAMVVGGMSGVVFVFTTNAMRTRREHGAVNS